MSDYIRRIITSGPVISFVDSDMIHNLLGDFIKIKSVMDQVVADCKAKGFVTEEDYERLEIQVTELEAAVSFNFYPRGVKEKVVLKINGKLVEESIAKIFVPLFKEAWEKDIKKKKKVTIKDDSDFLVFKNENAMGWRSFQLNLDDDE